MVSTIAFYAINPKINIFIWINQIIKKSMNGGGLEAEKILQDFFCNIISLFNIL